MAKEMKFVKNSRLIEIIFFLIVMQGRFPSTESLIISSVDYIFEAFSPFAMVQFFEFNEKGWSLSEACLGDMFTYLDGLRNMEIWAVKLYDATSYYSGSSIGGSRIRVGNPQTCRDLLKEFEEDIPKDVEENNSSTVPFPVQLVVGYYLLEFSDSNENKFQKVQQQICFPKSCHDNDLRQILMLQLFEGNNFVMNNSYIRHRIIKGDFSITQDVSFYVLIFLVCLPIIIYIVVDLLKLFFKLKSARNNRRGFPVGFSNSQMKRKSPLTANIESLFGKQFHMKIDMNWSLRRKKGNLPPIVRKNPKHRFEDFLDHISLQNIIYDLFRSEADFSQTKFFFILTMLIIYAHITAESFFMANNNAPGKEGDSNFILKYSTYIFDGFFVLSGATLAYNYFQGSPASKLNVSKNVIYIMKMISERILRHAFSYTFCIHTELLLDRYLQSNIAVEIPFLDYKNCDYRTILGAIFYWDTFIPVIERCIPWTWFMSLEVHLFMVSCLILLLAEIQPQFAIVIGSSIFVISIFAATLWEQNVEIRSSDLGYELVKFNLIYENFFLRIPPYLIGLYLGFILHRTGGNIQLNRLVLLCGWLGCFLILICFLFGFEMISAYLNKIMGIIFVILGHTVWALVVMWLILTLFACKDAAWNSWTYLKFINGLEVVSPICLLVAPIVIRFALFTTDGPIYVSNVRILPQVIGCIFLTYVIALFLHVLFDGLFGAIIRAITR